ncbi:MAG TPA: flagellar hook protein FlgE [Kofleriaceae bacterium]|nr:flagellar hook protein FlgE [Kofleriaceae bacterium]
MSISNSMYIGISGLEANGDAISVVGDNISNASTIGFKSERASFSDLLGGQLGAQRLGGGVMMSGTQTMWTQGAITTTGNPLDLAINGGGLFEVAGSANGQTGTFFTRDGQFQLDQNGYIVNQAGMRLQGYTIDSSGATSTTIGDLPVGARQSPPAATTTATMTANLDSNAPVPPAWDPANPSGTSSYNTSETVYDSLGNAHTVQMYFRNAGGGQWEWHAMVDGGDLTGGTKGTPTEIASGTLTFNSSGALQAQTTTASSASFVNATPNQAIAFEFGDDIASGGTGLAGTTQFSGNAAGTDSAVTGVDIDGHASGNLTSVQVGADGTVTGIFDNGDKRAIAQVAIASFANEDGLVRAGNGLMTESQDSGQAIVGAPGSGARGSITAGALEASNVDIGTELVTLINYQRAFEANSKTITTADQMLQDVNNLKQG